MRLDLETHHDGVVSPTALSNEPEEPCIKPGLHSPVNRLRAASILGVNAFSSPGRGYGSGLLRVDNLLVAGLDVEIDCGDMMECPLLTNEILCISVVFSDGNRFAPTYQIPPQTRSQLAESANYNVQRARLDVSAEHCHGW
jgi:hypothetical protein